MKIIDASQCVRKNNLDSDEVASVANEIIEYLQGHPNAADSLDGIVNWWLTRQRIKSAKDTVKKALDYLISEGVIDQKTHEGNESVYSNVTKDDKLTKH